MKRKKTIAAAVLALMERQKLVTEGAGAVSVAAGQTRDGLLRIAVSDNGRGFPPDMLGPFREIPRPQGHLGLYNVDTILLKYYGEGCGLTLENAERSTGAVVTAVLPVRREEGAEC